jgi:hypothetical protein
VLGDNSWLTLPLLGVKMHLFTFAFWLWLLGAVIMVAVSWLTSPPDPAVVRQFVWRPSQLDADSSKRWAWYRSVGFWSGIAAAMYALIYLRYW